MSKNYSVGYTRYVKKKDKNQWPMVHFALGIGLFLITAILARVGAFSNFDTALSTAIYRLPGYLLPIFYGFSLLGSVYMVGAAVISVYLMKKRKLARQLLIGSVLSYATVMVLKAWFAVPRPFEVFDTVFSREIFVTGYGFPSGHTAVATTLSLLFLRFVPQKYHLILVVWVAGVALSRIYLGVHSVLDVLGGFAIGLVVSQGLTIIEHKR